MRFVVVILGLHQIVEEFGDLMANGRPPWAAYRRQTLMADVMFVNNIKFLIDTPYSINGVTVEHVSTPTAKQFSKY